MALAAEGEFGAGEIEFEHAAEALVVERCDRVAVGGEAAAPVAQRLGIMQAQDLDVGGDQAASARPAAAPPTAPGE